MLAQVVPLSANLMVRLQDSLEVFRRWMSARKRDQSARAFRLVARTLLVSQATDNEGGRRIGEMSGKPVLRPVSQSVQFLLRSSLTIASLFTGAGIVHHSLKPDLVSLRRTQSAFLFSSDAKMLCFSCAQTVPSLEPPPPPKPKNTEGFVAAPNFAGKKDGFVFQTGPLGLGYYPDEPPQKAR